MFFLNNPEQYTDTLLHKKSSMNVILKDIGLTVNNVNDWVIDSVSKLMSKWRINTNVIVRKVSSMNVILKNIRRRE